MAELSLLNYLYYWQREPYRLKFEVYELYLKKNCLNHGKNTATYLSETVSSVSDNNRNLSPSSLYFAFKGEKYDPIFDLPFILYQNDLTAVVSDLDFEKLQKLLVEYEEKNMPAELQPAFADEKFGQGQRVYYIKTSQVREAYSLSCACFFDSISLLKQKSVKLVGITGTDGKTTTNRILTHLLLQAGRHVGSIGTIGNSFDYEKPSHAAYTSPPPLELHQLLQSYVLRGAEAVIMECSSQALSQLRLYGLSFDIACLTNLSEDHLDVHGNLQTYYEAKARLFSSLKANSLAIINLACRHHDILLQKCRSRKQYYYLLPQTASYRDFENIRRDIFASTAENQSLLGVELNKYKFFLAYIFDLKNAEDYNKLQKHLLAKNPVKQNLIQQNKQYFILAHGDEEVLFTLSMPGRYNVENSLAAIMAALEQGLNLNELSGYLSQFQGVPGRMEKYLLPENKNIYIDFAHTTEGIRSLLQAIKTSQNNLQQLIVTVNAAGERERNKRPEICKVCNAMADILIFTLEDIGRESPDQILQDLLAPLAEMAEKEKQGKEYYLCPNRFEALRFAGRLMAENSALVLLSLGDQHSIKAGDVEIYYEETLFAKNLQSEAEMHKFLMMKSALFRLNEKQEEKITQMYKEKYRLENIKDLLRQNLSK